MKSIKTLFFIGFSAAALGLAILPASLGTTDNRNQLPSVEINNVEKPHRHLPVLHDHEGYTEWNSDNSLPTSAGSYYLTQDVTLTNTWYVPTGTTNLCLNGHFIKSTSITGKVIAFSSAATATDYLNIYDDDETEHYYYIADDGAAVITTKDVAETHEKYGSFKGGHITGGSSRINVINGNLSLHNVDIVNTNNAAGQENVGILVSSNDVNVTSTAVIEGCSIIGNAGANKGYGVRCYGKSNVTIKDTLIKYNNKGLHVSSSENKPSTTTLYENVKVYDNTTWDLNFYNACINIESPLDSDHVMKVDFSEASILPLTFTSGLPGNGDEKLFTPVDSIKDTYAIALNADGEAVLYEKGTTYAFDSFDWSDDYSTAKAKYVNSDDPNDSVYYSATVNSAVLTPPTCTEKGTTVYNATYETHMESKEIQNIPATGHDYQFSKFEWAEDDKTAKAIYICSLCGEEDKHDATVTSEVKTQPTCSVKGTTTYTATYDTHSDTKDVQDIPTIPHTYHFTEFEWAEDGKTAKAVYVCSRCEIVDKRDATVTSTVLTQPTITAKGTTRYTATCEGHSENKDIQDIPMNQQFIDNNGVEVKDSAGNGLPYNISLKVELKTNVKEDPSSADYQKIVGLLNGNEKISNVYDVKLIRTVDGVETEIQPSDIKDGTIITVVMDLPEGINANGFRLLHIHSPNDAEFVTDFKVENNKVSFNVNKFSQFAFVTTTGGVPGWAIALIVIGGLLLLCCLCLLVLFIFFPVYYIDYTRREIRRAIFIKKHFNMVLILNTHLQFVRRNEVDLFKNNEDAQRVLGK